MLTIEDASEGYREQRLKTLGILGGRVVVLVWTERNTGPHLISLGTVTSVKPKTSSVIFNPEVIAAAIAAAPQEAVPDPDNPPTRECDWNDAVIVHEGGYPAVQAALEERQRTRGPRKASRKIPATIPFDADVLAGLRATGKGWQTHVNDLMREWLARRE